jgi:2-deoxy-D-gluconate 3-dehydrogenase
LAQAGARVVLAQRDVSNTDTLDAIRKLGGQADIIPCDLSIREDAAKVVDRALAIVDHIDILVNNGGMLQRADSVDVKDDDWDYVSVIKAVCTDLHYRS